MPVIGMIREDGELIKTKDALQEALKKGHVDKYAYSVLCMLLRGGRHATNPSASAIAGGALRRTVLQNMLDYYIEPKDNIAMMRGTLIHRGMEKAIHPGVKALGEKYLKVALPGPRKGRMLSGTLDRLYLEHGRLIDFKTCKYPPDVMYDSHLYQLATYGWLARWSGYELKDVAIVYIGWGDTKYVDVCGFNGELIAAIGHPLLTNEKTFLAWLNYRWNTLYIGYRANADGKYLVPGREDCNTRWCQNCSVRWACDRIPDAGGEVRPSDLKAEDYQ